MSSVTSRGVSSSGEILDSWSEIVAICEAGRAKDFYSVGNWKSLPLTEPASCTVKMELVGFNIDWWYKDFYTFSRAATTWMSKEAINKKFIAGAYTSGNAETAIYLNTTFYDALPEDLKSGLKNAQKTVLKSNAGNTTDYTNKIGSIYRQNYKVWAPNMFDLTVQYVDSGLFSTPNSRVRKLVGTTTAVNYWLQDGVATTNTIGEGNFYHARMSTAGKFELAGAAGSYLVFGFCI